LATCDIPALDRVAVSASEVSTAVADATDRLDPEVAVAQGTVAGERRGTAPDVKAIVSRADGDVAREEAVIIFPIHQEPVGAAPSDEVSTDHIVGAADWRRLDSEADTDHPSANDDVMGDQVAASILDPEAGHVSEGAVSSDHVSVARANEDAGGVSNAAVASHLIAVRLHEDPEFGVA
jgi:hypothetical protein